MKHGTGTPPVDGEYCAEIYWGWRVLSWREGVWHYHHDQNLPWKAGDPAQWVGPLPARIGAQPPKINQAPAMEYDL